MCAFSETFELCNNTYCKIVGEAGDALRLETLPWECQVVCLVWHTSGIVGNGGFRYLFEADLPGDPHYTKSRAAYEAIGATQAHAAFRDAIASFPDGLPPVNSDDRMDVFDQHPKGIWDEIESRYYADDEEMEQRLAIYIRDHRSKTDAYIARRG